MTTTYNSFIHHGIGHLSPSALNLWIEAPGIYALKYLKGLKDDGKAGLWRGTAVEVGYAALLRNQSVGKAIAAALSTFEQNAMGEISDEIDAERLLIGPMVRECAKWEPPSELNATQIKVEYWFDGIPVPVIGYVDLAFDGVDFDLKSTKSCPSSPRQGHVRQVSLYRAARGRDGGLLYVTAKKHAPFMVTDEMMKVGLSELEEAAHSLYRFLGRVESAEDAVRCLPVDRNHFMFPKQPKPTTTILSAG